LRQLAQTLGASPSASLLFPTVSYDGLLITDGPLFYRDDRVLFITHFPDEHRFRVQYRLGGETRLDSSCSEADIVAILVATFRDCYGITFTPAPAA
jgi:hypothetical protein